MGGTFSNPPDDEDDDDGLSFKPRPRPPYVPDQVYSHIEEIIEDGGIQFPLAMKSEWALLISRRRVPIMRFDVYKENEVRSSVSHVLWLNFDVDEADVESTWKRLLVEFPDSHGSPHPNVYTWTLEKSIDPSSLDVSGWVGETRLLARPDAGSVRVFFYVMMFDVFETVTIGLPTRPSEIHLVCKLPYPESLRRPTIEVSKQLILNYDVKPESVDVYFELESGVEKAAIEFLVEKNERPASVLTLFDHEQQGFRFKLHGYILTSQVGLPDVAIDHSINASLQSDIARTWAIYESARVNRALYQSLNVTRKDDMSAVGRFLVRDGDHAIGMRILKFMMPSAT